MSSQKRKWGFHLGVRIAIALNEELQVGHERLGEVAVLQIDPFHLVVGLQCQLESGFGSGSDFRFAFGFRLGFGLGLD